MTLLIVSNCAYMPRFCPVNLTGHFVQILTNKLQLILYPETKDTTNVSPLEETATSSADNLTWLECFT